jgi:hypothetical protein
MRPMHNAFLLKFWSVVAFKETVNVTEPKKNQGSLFHSHLKTAPKATRGSLSLLFENELLKNPSLVFLDKLHSLSPRVRFYTASLGPTNFSKSKHFTIGLSYSPNFKNVNF